MVAGVEDGVVVLVHAPGAVGWMGEIREVLNHISGLAVSTHFIVAAFVSVELTFSVRLIRGGPSWPTFFRTCLSFPLPLFLVHPPRAEGAFSLLSSLHRPLLFSHPIFLPKWRQDERSKGRRKL